MGMNVELEHGLHDAGTNVTDDDPHVTAKIALAAEPASRRRAGRARRRGFAARCRGK
jgi:hypothetical protein